MNRGAAQLYIDRLTEQQFHLYRWRHVLRTIGRIDPTWISAVARIPDSALDAIAGRWIELVGDEIGPLPREEKPWIRDLAGQIVSFCRRADRSADVLFVWSLR